MKKYLYLTAGLLSMPALYVLTGSVEPVALMAVLVGSLVYGFWPMDMGGMGGMSPPLP